MYKSIISFGVIAVVLNNIQAIFEEGQSEMQKKIIVYGAECIKKYPVSYEELLHLRLRIFPDNENVGCFAACVLKKVGLFDDKGNLVGLSEVHAAKKILGNSEEAKSIEKFVVECAKVNDALFKDGQPSCKRAKLAFNCYIENYEKFAFDLIAF